MLKKERRGIIDFAYNLNKNRKETDIELSYIMSPRDTAETFRALASDLFIISAIGQKMDFVDLSFATRILTPFPGTTIRDKYHGEIKRDMLYACYDTEGNLWKGAPLLEHMQKALVAVDPYFKKSKGALERNTLVVAYTLYPYLMRNVTPEECIAESDRNAFGEHLKNVSDHIKELSEQPLEELLKLFDAQFPAADATQTFKSI